MAVLSKLILAAAALAAPVEAVRMHTKASMEMNAMMMTTLQSKKFGEKSRDNENTLALRV